MMKLRLEAPWYTFQKKIAALFEKDDDVMVGELIENEDERFDYVLNIEVFNHDKFVALDRVIPSTKRFGNIIVGIMLYDAVNNASDSSAELYQTIFKGNPIVKDVKTITDQAGTNHVYVRFVPEVVQFFDDDLTDYSGNWSGLAEDIAEEVFENVVWNVNFCTAAKNKGLEKPLGEWP